MTITETLKRRFVKDTNLPIKVFDEPYFSHFLELYEEHFKAKTLFEMFRKELSGYENEQEYLAEYNRVKDTAITYLAENVNMQFFSQTEDMNKFNIKNTGFVSNSIFKETNVGRYFLSIDMVKANFSSLRHYDPAIVGHKDTYEDFIGMFTSSEYIKKSKYIRQVIFGNQNPKRQTTYEKYLMDHVLTSIFCRTKIEPSKVAYFGTDEIVLDVSDYVHNDKLEEAFKKQIDEIISMACRDGINVRGEYFQLYRIRGTAGYMKQFTFSTAKYKNVDFKCVDSLEMPFVIRAYSGENYTENDLIFVHEGKLAKFLNPLCVEFTTEKKI